MTIKNALTQASQKLKDKKITSANLDAEVLLSYVLKKPREYLYAYPEKQLTKLQQIRFQRLINKRCKHIPVAYLTHYKEFYGLDFYINKNVLIPRPETEILVEETLKQINQLTNQQINQLTLIDVGTGSGCIAITLAKHLPNAKIYATDISKKALIVARKNAKKHGVNKKIKFLHGNLLEPLFKHKKFASKFASNSPACPPAAIAFRAGNACNAGKHQNSHGTIIANLPYLTKNELANVSCEPKKALYSGKAGLDIYTELFNQLAQRKQLPKLILIEINDRQTDALTKIIKSHFPQSTVETKKDLAGKNRVLKIYRC